MPIADDWQFNYVPVTVNGYKEIVHIDGILVPADRRESHRAKQAF